MYQVKVKHGNKVYSYTRDKHTNSVFHGQWTLEDEKMFLECLGLPKLEEDGTVSRERWPVSRLEKLLWYKNCLTLRSNFDKLNAVKLNKVLDGMIKDEVATMGIGPMAAYEMMNNIEAEFKKVNYI